MNPQQLLLAAVSSCQLLSFLALAARSHIDILAYDDAEAVMPTETQPMRITRITLRPLIRLAAGSDLERVRRLVDRAHDACFVANSLRAEVHIDAGIGYSEER